jgi:UDP-N-acetylmuramoyl-tripeptide--D-alanyl-D-alanine ligase
MMPPMTTLAHIHSMLPGSQLLNISQEASELLTLNRVGSDSRQIDSGELFIALSGERFDAHHFLSDVKKSGASAALISKKELCPDDLAAVCVTDTQIGLSALAKAWRSQFSIPLALVTGSNGKTTAKEMIASIFKAAVGNENTLVTQGNLNNEIGLPLTLLRMRSSDRLGVIELGMNHPGETEKLALIARPNIALINNAQREHQEFMATVAAVAEEHAAALRCLPQDGVAVFPADSEYSVLWRKAAGQRKVLDFALIANRQASKASVVGRTSQNNQVDIETPAGHITVTLNTLGEHNIRNALAASAVALAAGIGLENIKVGLESFQPVNGRMQAKSLNAAQTLIDDSYNANPDSVKAAIDALKRSGNIAWLVLGDMGEVGNQGPEFHREVGAYAAEQGITKLFVLGEQGQFTAQGFKDAKEQYALLSDVAHYVDVELLINDLSSALRNFKALDQEHLDILVKGSRFMRMERVAQALIKEAESCS